MNKAGYSSCKFASRLAVATVFAGAGMLAMGASALAQPIETVTVTAPRVVQQTIVTGRSSSTGAPIEETTISRAVSFSDLDLTRKADASVLRTRVKDAAKALCEELDHLYPLEPKDHSCVRKSADRAMVQVDQAIADAHGK